MPLGRVFSLAIASISPFGVMWKTPKKPEFGGVLLVAERRVGEVSVAVAAHDDVVRSIETLALETCREYFCFPRFRYASHAPFAEFTGVEPALRIVSVADGTAGNVAQFGVFRAGNPLVEFIGDGVAEEKESFGGPCGAFQESQSGYDFFDADVGEVLRVG